MLPYLYLVSPVLSVEVTLFAELYFNISGAVSSTLSPHESNSFHCVVTPHLELCSMNLILIWMTRFIIFSDFHRNAEENGKVSVAF